mmetsp:Transcript_73830/g.171247  ORF Transcript_73830/g.171247 Transcript_73830/m.171247 type:complete len:857 (+) Transcript_73830:83-2653(+)
MLFDELDGPLRCYRPTLVATDVPAVVSTSSVTLGAAADPGPVDAAFEQRVQSLLSVGEECVTEVELRSLLGRKPNFVLYDGFEPSGRMHIAQGIFKAINVNKCTAAGGTFKFWVADWFALMNDKMGGDLEMIKDVGKYLIEVWKSSGMRMDNVQFIWCEQYLGELAEKYWTQMLDISRCSNLTRIKKCGMIMGRKEDGDLSSAQILYPIMQCTDIFVLGADICQLGVDQRKVNMLARDYCDAAGRKLKPIVLSHHMLYGLSQGQAKMSKSNPDSAVFMEDTAEDVERKIRKAYCPKTPGERDVLLSAEACSIDCDTGQFPPVVTSTSGFQDDSEVPELQAGDQLLFIDDEPVGQCADRLTELLKKRPVLLTVKRPSAVAAAKPLVGDDDTMRLVKDDLENPILDYIKHIVLGAEDSLPVEIDSHSYSSEQEIREAFCAGGFESKGRISKVQLKKVVIERVNQMLQAARKHFTENAEAKRLLELVESHKKAVKEGKVSVPKTVRCLKGLTVFSEGVASSAVVFAPRPPTVPALSVDVVLSCLVALHRATEGSQKVVLWCEDWSAFCLGRCSASEGPEALRLLALWYGLLVDSLKLIAPQLMEKVQPLYQSQEILRSPNAYWISVIDVGRSFKLDRIRRSLADDETLTESSQVVTTLMHVADLLALCVAPGLGSLRAVAFQGGAAAHHSAAEYLAEDVMPKAKACGELLVMPEILELEPTFTDVPLEVLVGDGEPTVNGRVKKLFCLAGDAVNCPCIDLLEKLDATGQLRRHNPNGEFLVISGNAKSGHLEDRAYSNAASIREAFSQGEASVHPGDLKAAVAPLVRAVLGPLLQCKDPGFLKAHKELANAAKKSVKKK